jgi:flagellin
MAEVDVTRIAGNIGAMNSLNALANINKQLSVHQTRLATGKRINSAADDPAGLTIATKFQARSEGLKTALSNIGDAKNLLAVAESGLGRINDILVQMRNKAEQAASDTMGTEERAAIKKQLSAYAAQIDDIVDQTKWNNTTLLKKELGDPATLRFQTGADATDATVMDRIDGLDAVTLNVATKNAAGAKAAVSGEALGVWNAGFTAAGSQMNTATIDGVNELASGTYTVKATTSSDNSEVTLQLFDASGTMVALDEDGADNGTLGWSRTVDNDGSVVDLGNGLSLDLNNTQLAGNNATYTQKITYTRTGDYQVSANDASGFANYMTTVETAMGKINEKLSDIGALTGRLSFKEDQVSAAQVNVEAAYNRIMNANMAEEQVNASKYQILQQTATAMLSQANSAPQFLLSLFR